MSPGRLIIGQPGYKCGKHRAHKGFSDKTVCVGYGELLTSTGDIVRQWKVYFKDILNPIDTPSTKEAEALDSKVDSS